MGCVRARVVGYPPEAPVKVDHRQGREYIDHIDHIVILMPERFAADAPL